ncbi:MAG TPA: ATP-binding protein [Parafilimonas sp.]
MAFQFIIIILVVRYLRKTLNTPVTTPAWDKRFQMAIYISIGLFVASLIVSSLSLLFNIAGYLILFGLIYLIKEKEEFKPAKFLFVALLPYLAVSVLSELVKATAKQFYTNQKNIIDSINTCTILWGFGVWLVTRRQQKELTSMRAKALEEEQNNKVINAVKMQLEVQVAERTAELTQQKEELEKTLVELKSTQAQLIQSEKMASLGELTAGIAHEIQNPLNFVNNFSEVNKEMLEELRAERLKPKAERDEQTEDDIINDVIANEEKIAHHGKRADAIVKGMLQHSRKNSGQKEATDINALCDEYLRLSYHGLRAKDKSFNADFKTDFDDSIGKVNIVSQDVGRVLLNLFNNAFYAVNEKKKLMANSYQPIAKVSTRRLNNKIEIRIEDNGNGIPQNVIDKIFQPFFTTKPTGEGTGLGLSLSYDIIKAHGGEIKVESKEGEGSAFIITIPTE